MHADELDRRFHSHDDWIPASVVSLLIEHGHLDEVRRLAGRGEWWCARALAQSLVDQDRVDAAVDLLRPFIDTGWWEAVRTVAAILDERGRTAEAVALVRPYAEAGDRFARNKLAALLARQGRVDEVFALLGPHVADWYPARALVDLTAGLGRDAEVIELLRPHVGKPERGRGWGHEMEHVELMATVLERQGLVDEAVKLLESYYHRDDVIYVNHVEQLADLLARHGRSARLRELAAAPGGENAAYRLAEVLEQQGRLDDATAQLRPLAAGDPNAASYLADLLARHDRTGEAVAVLRTAANSIPTAADWLLRQMSTLLVDQGRAEEALALIDEFAGPGLMDSEYFLNRVYVLERCGQVDEAIAELRAHPDSEAWYLAGTTTRLLAGAGRIDEAIELLSPSAGEPSANTALLAELLVKQGRAEDAIALLHR
ncbi:tetratricopeptide repeat protein [Catellatospora sichuanensis]|uniref:tetratricopeptide repeat protein n=1 Tax=Catellatospora sichuanensis TaxID=1969805 RepID=UPI001C90BCA4|nr:tetratricopeptide repeat protein [Catellatospora sichuanensis]